MSRIRSFIDGFMGIFLEIYYIFYVKYCPECGSRFNGYYCKKYMKYCHTCGTELKVGNELMELTKYED